MIPSSEKKNIQRKEFIKRILEKRSHIPASTKDEQSVVCAKQGPSNKEVVAEVIGNEVNAFSATPSAQRDGTADAVASDLGMKEAPKTSAEVVGENLEDGKDKRTEHLAKGDVIAHDFSRPKKKEDSTVASVGSVGKTSFERQKDIMARYKEAANKHTMAAYRIPPPKSQTPPPPGQKTKEFVSQYRDTDSKPKGLDKLKPSSKEKTKKAQVIDMKQKMTEKKQEAARPNPDEPTPEERRQRIMTSIGKINTLISSLKDTSPDMKKSDPWDKDPEANRIDSKKQRPAPTPPPAEPAANEGVDLKFDTPPMPKIEAKPPQAAPAISKTKRVQWLAKFGGKWYPVKNIVDNGMPVEQGGGNMYHLEGLDVPVHANHLEDLEIHRK